MTQRLNPTKDDDDTWHSAVVSHAQKGKSMNCTESKYVITNALKIYHHLLTRAEGE